MCCQLCRTAGSAASLSRARKSCAEPGSAAYGSQDVDFAGFKLEMEVPQTQVGGQHVSIECRVVELSTVQPLSEDC